jgi:hypothetical protein
MNVNTTTANQSHVQAHEELVFPHSPVIVVVGVVYLLRFVVAAAVRVAVPTTTTMPVSELGETWPSPENENENQHTTDNASSTTRAGHFKPAGGAITTSKALKLTSVVFDALDALAIAQLGANSSESPTSTLITVAFIAAWVVLGLGVVLRCCTQDAHTGKGFFGPSSRYLSQFSGAILLLYVPALYKSYPSDPIYLAWLLAVPPVVWFCGNKATTRLVGNAVTTGARGTDGRVDDERAMALSNNNNPYRSCLKRFWLYTPRSFIDGDLDAIDLEETSGGVIHDADVHVHERRPLTPPNVPRPTTVQRQHDTEGVVRTQELVLMET